MFLTAEEVARLTARQQAPAQIRQLTRLGLRYFVDADGRPVVARSEIEGNQAAPPPDPEPNWSALDGKKANAS